MAQPLEANKNINYEDEDYFIPLEDQRVFGAGIKRKRVPFVRPSSENSVLKTSYDPSTDTSPSRSRASSVVDQYLSIVLSKKNKIAVEDTSSLSATTSLATSSSAARDAINSRDTPVSLAESTSICEICKLPLSISDNIIAATTDNDGSNTSHASAPHEASLAHQVCLTHSHPPSHLDRTRHGMRYLSAYGWDPDNRLGLGAPGREGIREPVKTKAKNDTVGLGMNSGREESDDDGHQNNLKISQKSKERKRKEQERAAKSATAAARIPKMDAKKTRLAELEERRRREKLQEMFYRSEDVLRYLGENG